MSLADRLAQHHRDNTDQARAVTRALTAAGVDVTPFDRFPAEGVYVGTTRSSRVEVVVNIDEPLTRQALIGTVRDALEATGYTATPDEQHPAILNTTR